MSVNASPDIIREMITSIKKAIQEINGIERGIQLGIKSQSGWDDEQSRRYHELMLQIARLISEPIQTLEGAVPRMEELAQALDNYNRVRF